MGERRRTKIVTTIGPATRSFEQMVALIEAGADIFRLNFSHGTQAEHGENIANARKAAEQTGKEIGLLGDLPGPKLRLGDIAGDSIDLHRGNPVRLVVGDCADDELPITWDGLPEAVSKGDEIYLADGRIRLRVEETSDTTVDTVVEAGGVVSSHQGLNLPGVEVPLPSAGHEDLAWVDFAIEQKIDLLAVSFVRRAEDLEPVSRRIRIAGSDIPLIAKIEKPQAAERAESIVRAAVSGIMVARGDLGIELPIHQVPVAQKRLISLAGRWSKPSITATQMLASMVTSPRPTRAEVSDVANAIWQGTDAIMLSEETAVGEYAIEAVETMVAIAREVEQDLPYGDWVFHRVQEEAGDVASSVARAAVGSTYTLGLKALVVPTRSGRTARLVSAHRPSVPVLAVSPRIETVRRLNLLFGVECALSEEWDGITQLLGDCARLAAETGVARSGDLIAITAGLPAQQLGTNLFEVHRVP
ncbi:pyruvate kinase [Thermoleophilia bacterium SCSIO 60948]|nr:pyruvate kinase [Thermoleophilia bacterium SCSIO 60948]